MDELKTKNRYAIQAKNEDTLQRVYKSMKIRFNFAIRERGRSFEHLIN